MGVDEVLRLLGEQEAMCQAEVERLEAEQERLADLLATCRVELEHLVVAREVIAGLVPASPVTAAASAGSGVPAVESTEFGQQLLNILAEHAGPMRCWDIVAAMGEDPRVARHCYDAAPAIRNAATCYRPPPSNARTAGLARPRPAGTSTPRSRTASPS